ncbi:tyrosine-type recombinase/integrase [Streptosporangium sp. NPDC001681]|uniref:tyrosine-type recombinase/integrase n=1 Tax=Streptosporangium sp. NPDC001681 TaxID=3154395 RepID=UPI003323DEE3
MWARATSHGRFWPTRRATSSASSARPDAEPPRLLRHAHATGLINDGVPIEVVRRRLGHASTETTRRTTPTPSPLDT